MSSSTLRLAVFGHPIAHSRSPELHSRFAAQFGLDVEYRAIDCRSGGLADALDRFRAEGGAGCNLTVPLKGEGLALAADASPAARSAAACNTLVRRGEGWFADNTDGAGLLADLDRLALDPAGRRILLVGAGGAMAGVLEALLARRPARIGIVNRSVDRASALAARVRDAEIPVEVFDFEGGMTAGGFELVLQGTSLGHHGEAPALDREWLTSKASAYDLNYGPAHAPFAHWCAMHRVSCHGGWGMLVEQAAEAFQRFTGQRPETSGFYPA